MPTYIPERNVLKPKDPAIKDNNDWEQFRLTNAEVRDAKTGELTSLLMADAMEPVVVTGNLEQVTKKQQSLLLRPEYRPSTPIKIENVMIFSYGNDPDDKEDPDAIQIWASGGAGWFKIKPGRAYKDIHKEMQECIELLWFAADVYANVKKAAAGPSAEMVFREYAEDEDTACSTVEEARELFYRHRKFLMLAMINGKEGVTWGRIPLRMHLRQEFPDEFNAMYNKFHFKSAEPHTNTKKTAVNSNEDDQTRSKTVSSTTVARAPTSGHPKRDENWFQSRAIWEVILKAESQKLLKPESMSVLDIAKIMLKRYEIDDVEVAAIYIKAHAANIRYMMQHKSSKKDAVQWPKMPIFRELQKGTTNLPAATVRKAHEVELKPRKVQVEVQSEAPSERFSSDEPSNRRARRSQKGRLSVLRPKVSKFAGKVANKHGKAPPPTNSIPEDDSSDAGSDRMELTSPSKRKSTDTNHLNPNKRSSPRSGTSDSLPDAPVTPTNLSDSEVSDKEDSDLEASDISSPENVTNENFPLPWKASNSPSSTTYLATLVSSPLPSYEPNAPGNVWACTFDGCSHRVFGASSEASRQLIKEHYQEHTRPVGQQAQLDLIMNEEQRSRLPVNNLIARIREMAAAKQSVLDPPFSSSTAGGSSGFPIPIERKI